jgi:hypothetical protein
MPDYGICSSSEERCGLSYQSHGLSRLPELIRVIEQRRLEGKDANALVQQLGAFMRFFQDRDFCSECGAVLIKMTYPTAKLVPGSEEYRRTTKANEMIDAMHRLQALRVLPV